MDELTCKIAVQNKISGELPTEEWLTYKMECFQIKEAVENI